LKAIDSLKILLAPFLPFTSERLNGFFGNDRPLFGKQYIDTISDDLGTHAALRYDPDGASGKWEPSKLEPGKRTVNPQPLFKKLDASIIEEDASVWVIKPDQTESSSARFEDPQPGGFLNTFCDGIGL
jgi:methionyl-tRNA synthetase